MGQWATKLMEMSKTSSKRRSEEEAVELHERGEDEELVVLVLFNRGTTEIADDVRHAIPRLHRLWCVADDREDEGGFAVLVLGTLERFTAVSRRREEIDGSTTLRLTSSEHCERWACVDLRDVGM